MWKDISREDIQVEYKVYATGGMYINELRFIDTQIDSKSFYNINIDKLYLSKYTQLNVKSFIDCHINELYFLVETQEEADKITNLFYNQTAKLNQFSGCRIKRFVPVVRSALKQEIYKLMRS